MLSINLRQQHDKFPQDALSFENDHYTLRTGGVFLGIETTKVSLPEHLIQAYESRGEQFAADLRGSFLIHLHDKVRDLHLVYTNHVGDKRVFYYAENGNNIVSDSLQDLTSELRKARLSYSPDRDAAYFLLTFGHTYGNQTLISEIRRLGPGKYLKIEKDSFRELSYYELDNTPDTTLSYQDSLEQADVLFRQAISREMDKDLEYGYSHLCSLSGGLDSRMTTWVARDLGYRNIHNLTFGRKGSGDMTIPEKMAADLGHEWISLDLDDAGFMGDIDGVSRITEGSISYLPISHGTWAMSRVDFSNFGLLHSGNLGDVVIGTFMPSPRHQAPAYKKIISGELVHKLPPGEKENYKDLELMNFLNRGYNYALSGNLSIQTYTEVASPFTDVDLMDFCLRIPLEYRVQHRLYKDWIIQKYPGAADYPWEKLGRKITEKTIKLRGKEISVSGLPSFMAQAVQYHFNRITKRHIATNTGMNPFQYWYNTRPDIRESLEQYFRDYSGLIEDRELRQDCETLFRTGNISEKAMVLSLLAAMRLYWE